MNRFLTKVLFDSIPYTGSELRNHWVAHRLGEFCSGVVAFRGACSVATAEMVDLEDRRDGNTIKAKEMVHFLGEWFGMPLPEAITLQRLFIAGFADLLNERLQEKTGSVLRTGNDLYFFSQSIKEEKAKLSVSIVTATPVSCLFHFGVNIDSEGAPVRAVGLKDLGLSSTELMDSALRLWEKEWNSIQRARCKVAVR